MITAEIQLVLDRAIELDRAKAALHDAVKQAFPIGSEFKFSHGYHKTAWNEPLKPRMHDGVVLSHDAYDGKSIGVRNVKTGKVRRVDAVYEVSCHWDLENDL